MKYMYLLALPIFFLFLAWSNNHVEVQKPIVVTGKIVFNTTKGEIALDGGYVKLSIDKVQTDKYNANTNASGEFSIDIGVKEDDYKQVYASFVSFSTKEGNKFTMPEKLNLKVSKTFERGRGEWDLETSTFTKDETSSKLIIDIGTLYIDLKKSN